MNRVSSAEPEVSGAFLLGLVESFGKVVALDLDRLNVDLSGVAPDGWYPYAWFMEILHALERTGVSQHVVTSAGMAFLRIWYEHGPGKVMMHSSRDWLLLHGEGQGYNSVVRGGPPEQIGFAVATTLDLDNGFAVYEDISPLPAEFVRGVYYGGCLIFDDLDYVDVQAATHPYPANPAFRRKVIEVRFRDRDHSVDVDARVAELGGGAPSKRATAQTSMPCSPRRLLLRGPTRWTWRRPRNGPKPPTAPRASSWPT